MCTHIHILTQIAEHPCYLCRSRISEQPTPAVLILLDYGDEYDATHYLLFLAGVQEALAIFACTCK